VFLFFLTHGTRAGAELAQLARQVHGVPEEYPIKVVTPDSSDQPFDERMRDRNGRNRLDLLDLEDAQVGEPAVESKQRVVVGTSDGRKADALKLGRSARRLFCVS
jgi:hypothetical protein